jgi:hypothetical protein
MIVYEPPDVGFVEEGPYEVPSFTVPEYVYATVTVSEPIRPDCE